MPRPAAREDAAEKAPGFGDSLLGGFAFTLASLAAVFAIVFGMQFAMALPQPVDGGKTLADTSTAVGVGILYTFYHLGFAMIIWLGVLIAVKATGGRATFGAMLWKCFALCGAVTIFFRITDQWFLGTIFGIIPGVFFALRYTAVGAGVSSMFELENGPRRLVVAVGMLLTELFGFTFYIVFGVLIGLQVIHVEKPPRDPENDARIQQFQEEMRQALDKAKAEHATGQPAATPAPDAAPAANPPAAPAQ
jgi:hypothetical protein